MIVADTLKVFGRKGRFVIKRLKENKLVTYDGKSFSLATEIEAVAVASAIANDNKHVLGDMGYWSSRIK